MMDLLSEEAGGFEEGALQDEGGPWRGDGRVGQARHAQGGGAEKILSSLIKIILSYIKYFIN